MTVSVEVDRWAVREVVAMPVIATCEGRASVAVSPMPGETFGRRSMRVAVSPMPGETFEGRPVREAVVARCR